MNNCVQYLKSLRFSSLTLQEKCEVKNRGRPTPMVDIKQSSTSRQKQYTRSFNPDVYKKFEWLCGCETQNALFCFPCLLFGGDATWTKKGMADLRKLNEKIHKHLISAKHVNNVLNLAVLGSVNVQTSLSMAHKESIERHNNQVHKNRDALSKIINCIKFCGSNELSLRGHDESKNSENPGIFLALVKYTCAIDSLLKSHLESSSSFKGTSKTIQNELLECMLEVCRENILAEVGEAEFIAVMSDETTDCANAFQLVIVLRYCNKQGNPFERFWGFFAPSGQSASAISESILSQLDIILKSEKGKLIGQSYDGAAVMSGAINGVQSKIKEVYQNAYFVHCFAHQLNLIMERAASQNTKARIFFANLSAIPTFFSRSPHRLSVLDSFAAKKIPSAGATRWNFKSRTVNAVHENKDALLKCFEILMESETSSNSTINESSGLMRTLQDPEFNFWLSFFHLIMPHVDILYNKLQIRQTDAAKIQMCISGFVTAINAIRDRVGVNSENAEMENENKRRHVQDSQTRIAAAKEVCDVVITQAKTWFQFINHLQVSTLLCASNFEIFNNCFPSKELDECTKLFPIFDKDKLRTELSVIYSREEFRPFSGAIQLLQYLLSNNLQESFSEVLKLLRIAITLPMTTAEPERCFSSLKRIKTYLRNTIGEERLTALAMLSMEKNMVNNIPNFNKMVIDKFATYKSRRMELIYK